jgi:putative methanogenesis marker protein 8
LSHEVNPICTKPCGSHEIYCCGSRVKISEKGVVAVTKPVVRHCPLHESLYGTKRIDSRTVENGVERKIREFGFCCKNREFSLDPIVAYGASEMMSVWLGKHLIDCAVVVCEGAGTVMTNNAKLVQGIGERLTGIIKTSPIRQMIQYIEKNGGKVLDDTSTRIDQVEGVRQAFLTGSKRVAVSVASFQSKAISGIRQLEKIERKEALVFSVCNTLAKDVDVKHIVKADIVCASASRILRNQVGSKALLQVGITIPVYALTQRGKEMMLAYLEAFKDRLVIFRTGKLPYEAKNKGPVLTEISHRRKA